MSVTIKSLNGDTTFLLTFLPPTPPTTSPNPSSSPVQSAFTVLIDPWLTGAAHVLTPKFALIKHKEKPCINSLAQLAAEPDLILISQEKPDHCHKETLCQLPQDVNSTILATPAAAKKIQKWKHFVRAPIISMERYVDHAEPSSVYRHKLPATSPSGLPGEVTVSFISSRWDLKGLHNAIGITYRAPSDEAVASTAPITKVAYPPDSPMSPRSVSTALKTLTPMAVRNDDHRTVSVVYSPHGIAYSKIRPYATQHLAAEGALPLSALIHSLDRVENPWYLGGNIAAGFPGGQSLVRNLSCNAWIAAHDADKDKTGVSVQLTKILKFAPERAQGTLNEAFGKLDNGKTVATEVVSLGVGQEYEAGTT